jgi:excisionase family DNA binding protein
MDRLGSMTNTALPADAPTPLTVTFRRAGELTGLGQTTLWKLVKDGQLTVVRVGGRTLIHFSSLHRLFACGSEKPAPHSSRRRGRPRKLPAGGVAT